MPVFPPTLSRANYTGGPERHDAAYTAFQKRSKTTESEKLGQKYNTVSKMFFNLGEYTGEVSTDNSHGKASILMIPPIHDAA